MEECQFPGVSRAQMAEMLVELPQISVSILHNRYALASVDHYMEEGRGNAMTDREAQGLSSISRVGL